MLFSLRLLPHGLALGAALLAGSASAQPADVVRARQLLAEARTAAEKESDPDPGKWMEAALLIGLAEGLVDRAEGRQP